MRWIIDGNNCVGARPDGWWRDRAGAKRRLAKAVSRWADGQDAFVILVFDGRPLPAVDDLAHPDLAIAWSGSNRRDGADDVIAAMAAEEPSRVVTSDRGLRARLPDDAEVLGAGAFRRMLDRV